MDHKKIIEYLFFAIVSGIGTIGVSYVHQISETMMKLTQNVVELNARIEILSTRVLHTDDAIKDHEIRLRQIESERKR